MTDLTRRRLLAATGAVGAAAIAGCSSSADEDDEPADDDEGEDEPADDDENGGNEPRGTELGEISIENVDDAPHTVDVLVEFGDEIQHWSTHELEAGGDGVTLERDWSSDPGEFRVTVRLDGEEFTQVAPERWNNPACLNLLALVNRDGVVRVLSDTSGGECGTGDPDFDE